MTKNHVGDNMDGRMQTNTMENGSVIEMNKTPDLHNI